MFSSFVGTSKIVFAQAQLLSIAGCGFLLGLSWLLLWFCCFSGSDSDFGYGYNRWLLLFLQVCGISCIPPRFKRDGSRGKWAAVAVQLVECGKPSCRQSKLLMSVRPWLRVEVQHELRVPATSYALLPDCASRQLPRGTYFY